MKPGEIKRSIYRVGAIDWDRRLFNALIPLPDGTSYNSYLINGTEKTVLINSVDPTMQDVLVNHLLLPKNTKSMALLDNVLPEGGQESPEQ